jgi:hypothetical protein
VSRTHLDPLHVCRLEPALCDAPAWEREGVFAVRIEDRKFEIALERS